jgi:hypothetical protein
VNDAPTQPTDESATAEGETRDALAAKPSSQSDLYRLLVESVSDYAIFALDATGHVLSWNPGA